MWKQSTLKTLVLFFLSLAMLFSIATWKAEAQGTSSGRTSTTFTNITVTGTANVSSMTIGANTSYSGFVSLKGATSGSEGWTSAAVAGTPTLYVMPTTGMLNAFLQDNGPTTCPNLPPTAPATCRATSWQAAGGSAPSGTGVAIVSSGSWGTTLPLVTTVNGSSTDSQIPTAKAVYTAASAGAGGSIDFGIGSMDAAQGSLVGVWKKNGSASPPGIYGGNYYTSAIMGTSGDFLVTNFRLPKSWTGTGVTVYLATIDMDGNGRAISYTVQIGCTNTGDSVYLTDPTFGSTATLSGTQGSNSLLELTASLPLPANCTSGGGNGSGSLKQARLKLIRTGAWTGNHGVNDVALSW